MKTCADIDIRAVTGNRVLYYLFLALLATVAIKYTTFYYDQESDLDWTQYFYDRGETAQPPCFSSIPRLTPFDQSVEYLRNKSLLPSVNCENGTFILFNSTLNSTLIPAKDKNYIREILGYDSCCYLSVKRKDKDYRSDWSESTSNECFNLSLSKETKIPMEHEFINIVCKKGNNTPHLQMKEIHAFVPQKQKDGYLGTDDGNEGGNKKLNVLILGLDAASRQQFLRAMPQTYSFLKKELNAVEMIGYNKVGDNTFPNIFPMLTSYHTFELNCTESHSLDGCPFIWKNFSKKGYYTTYAEDRPSISAFNFEYPGFRKQPTDYYLRPIMHYANSKYFMKPNCVGPVLSFQFLMDYMKKGVYTIKKMKRIFFNFIWATGLTHDSLNTTYLGDPILLESIKWLMQSGYLNDTVFILMSDHGQRVQEPFRSSIRGQLEDRLPFMFFVLPDCFKEDYSKAYKNLQSNANKLTTTFDLHETLRDILKLNNLKETTLAERESRLKFQEMNSILPRGISHFIPIPESRTCEAAGIPKIFCSCKFFKATDVNDKTIWEIGNAAVSHINSILKSKPKCAHLELVKVTMAQEAKDLRKKLKSFLINFKTKPGGGTFEALVGQNLSSGEWVVEGKILRTNRYGNQGYCANDNSLNLYCYCPEKTLS